MALHIFQDFTLLCKRQAKDKKNKSLISFEFFEKEEKPIHEMFRILFHYRKRWRRPSKYFCSALRVSLLKAFGPSGNVPRMRWTSLEKLPWIGLWAMLKKNVSKGWIIETLHACWICFIYDGVTKRQERNFGNWSHHEIICISQR